MAGLPLKSGADFYNLEAARLRLHNLGADPTEVGAGLIYFNTSSGMNTSKKARIYTGDVWKTIAFSEDLDVASNADFLALKERVDLLSGDVDTDAIISNMKEVSAFLEGFAEDASLMDLLNGKLNTSGGTIEGKNFAPLVIKRTSSNNGVAIRFENSDGLLGNLGVAPSESGAYPIFGDGTNNYTILHSGNYSNYALPLSGGEIKGVDPYHQYMLTLDTDNAYYTILSLKNQGVRKGMFAWANDEATMKGVFIQNNTTKDVLGLSDDGVPMYNKNTLLHSGNIGSYKAGDSDKLGGLEASGYAKNIKDLKNDLANIDASLYGLYGGKLQGSEGTFPTIDGGYEYGAFLSFGWHGYGVQISSRKHKTWLRASENGTYSDWKQIAFTDSDVLNSDGDILLTYNDGLLLGYGSALKSKNTIIYGNSVVMRYSSNRTQGFILNSSGNVTIGASDLARTDAKLYVDGDIHLGIEKLCSIGAPYSSSDLTLYNRISINNATSGIKYYSGGWASNTSYISHEFIVGINNTSALAITNGGNILIGTATDNGSGARLQVAGNIHAANATITKYIYAKAFRTEGECGVWKGNSFSSSLTETDLVIKGDTVKLIGNLHVTGNIIADGEVSAGGAAEEGGNAGGGGAFHSESIGVGATQTTIAHGLGTDDIVVSIYEKDGVSGRWSLILTDVEVVDANNIIVSFGSATSVEHKVVIMGAVA